LKDFKAFPQSVPLRFGRIRISWTVHGGGQFRILDHAWWKQVQDPGESFTVHGGGKCKILENPSPCMVEASARSWRILHRARWRQVQERWDNEQIDASFAVVLVDQVG